MANKKREYSRLEGKNLIFNPKITRLCLCPFYKHPHGCPNYGKKIGCPPRTELVDQLLDLNDDVYIIHLAFPVGIFAEKMRQKHPKWTARQCYNPRLWQPTARKKHRKLLADFQKKHPNLLILTSPEANGMDVTKTLKKIGISLNWQWPPDHQTNNLVYLVAIAGTPKRKIPST